MPCSCEGMAESDNARLHRELDHLTALLCEFAQHVAPIQTPDLWPETVRTWWALHQRKDAARLKRQQLNKDAAKARLRRQREEIDQELAKLGE